MILTNKPNKIKEYILYKAVKQHRLNENNVINYKSRIFLVNQIPL